ncbi:unnamed protein product [Didymodactylos carnosus]|uniref:Uncharacterized protein n=2 Tax=Didymodactylos carnosus TaxID=1234261 RepID=A0A814XLK5_9BILA|nr:unnamed protein product [Didymodactylos carnosus]CAF3979572.1 unnamed protein product [Didymodactylos carnosus]
MDLDDRLEKEELINDQSNDGDSDPADKKKPVDTFNSVDNNSKSQRDTSTAFASKVQLTPRSQVTKRKFGRELNNLEDALSLHEKVAGKRNCTKIM